MNSSELLQVGVMAGDLLDLYDISLNMMLSLCLLGEDAISSKSKALRPSLFSKLYLWHH